MKAHKTTEAVKALSAEAYMLPKEAESRRQSSRESMVGLVPRSLSELRSFWLLWMRLSSSPFWMWQ